MSHANKQDGARLKTHTHTLPPHASSVLHVLLAAPQDGVLCYCRLSLALGGVPSAGGGMTLQDLLSLVTRDINTPTFTW